MRAGLDRDKCSTGAFDDRSRGFGRTLAVFAIAVTAALVLAPAASADSLGPIDFESPAYSTGNVNGQNGWSKTGSYDSEVASVGGFGAAAGYGFGAQALRISNAVTSGAFGDQTFSPGLSEPAGEAAPRTHFEASFKIGTTEATEQSGLALSVSPDDGDGSRMSYLRFEDQADGVHVIFDDTTDARFGDEAEFNETDIATLSRGASHTIRFSIDFLPGPANDVVKIYIDGALAITGTTWEDYYRYDPEQAGNGNVVPDVSKLLFREAGARGPRQRRPGLPDRRCRARPRAPPRRRPSTTTRPAPARPARTARRPTTRRSAKRSRRCPPARRSSSAPVNTKKTSRSIAALTIRGDGDDSVVYPALAGPTCAEGSLCPRRQQRLPRPVERCDDRTPRSSTATTRTSPARARSRPATGSSPTTRWGRSTASTSTTPPCATSSCAASTPPAAAASPSTTTRSNTSHPTRRRSRSSTSAAPAR